jgi:hypothetical protein
MANIRVDTANSREPLRSELKEALGSSSSRRAAICAGMTLRGRATESRLAALPILARATASDSGFGRGDATAIGAAGVTALENLPASFTALAKRFSFGVVLGDAASSTGVDCGLVARGVSALTSGDGDTGVFVLERETASNLDETAKSRDGERSERSGVLTSGSSARRASSCGATLRGFCNTKSRLLTPDRSPLDAGEGAVLLVGVTGLGDCGAATVLVGLASLLLNRTVLATFLNFAMPTFLLAGVPLFSGASAAPGSAIPAPSNACGEGLVRTVAGSSSSSFA